jgi:hypothetical protein
MSGHGEIGSRFDFLAGLGCDPSIATKRLIGTAGFKRSYTFKYCNNEWENPSVHEESTLAEGKTCLDTGVH